MLFKNRKVELSHFSSSWGSRNKYPGKMERERKGEGVKEKARKITKKIKEWAREREENTYFSIQKV